MHRVLTGVFALAITTLAPSQSPPRLLADLDPRVVPRTPLGSGPALFARLGAWTYFVADDGVHGRELFRTNGTAVGTTFFADLRPGPESSSPRMLTVAGTRLFFFADDGVNGEQPFVCDGTVAGTRRITTIIQGRQAGLYSASLALGDRFLFLAGWFEQEDLWITDGTLLGTRRLVHWADLEEGERLWLWGTTVLTPAGAAPQLLFSSSASGVRLWRTDGTVAGTLRVSLPASSRPSIPAIVPLGDRALVLMMEQAFTPQVRTLLYAWDGANAPQLLAAFPGGAFNLVAQAFDGRVWFTPGGGPFGFMLVSDGTAAGTRVIPSSRYTPSATAGAVLGVIGGALWITSGTRLFRVDPGAQDPVPAGTLPMDLDSAQRGPVIGTRRLVVTSDYRLRTVEPSALAVTDLGIGFPPTGIVELGEGLGRAYFRYEDPVAGSEPWTTDGTLGGTRLLADLRPNSLLTRDSNPRRFRAFCDSMAFLTYDSQTRDSTLWLSDGTAAGTRAITSGFTDGYFATTVAGQLFVQIQDPTLGDALLVTDGTTNGTRRLSIPPRPQSSYSVPVALGRELVLFRSKSGRPGIFATDGFAVRFVRDLPGTAVGGEPVRLGERIVFSIHGGLADRVELWSTDATASGTQQLLTFAAILGLKRWRDRVWFLARANSTTGPIELWSTDGTAANTAPFARLSTSPYGYSLVATRERLFALAMDTLLAFDGVSPSPVMIRSPIGWIERANARSVGERLVFEVKSGAIPGQSVLWSSDGTTSGTTPISSPYQRWSSSTGTTLIPIGARHALFITENAGTWITDGTASGTRFFWDRFVLDGEIPYYERSLNAANGLAWVSAYDPVFGQEPYVIDLDSSIEPLSRGCGGLDREAELFASLGPAPLGGLTVEGRSSAGGMALVFLSAPPLRPTPLPSAGRCVLDVDPNAHVVLIQTPLTNGRFARTWPLPADAALRGVQATLQAAIAPTDAPLGFDLSNGLLVNLWR